MLEKYFSMNETKRGVYDTGTESACETHKKKSRKQVCAPDCTSYNRNKKKSRKKT